MKTVINTLIALVVIAFVAFLFIALPKRLPSDYKCQIIVDKYEKIPQAMTNAVSDVTSRDFIVIKLGVEKFPLAKTYCITCQGITRARLLKTSD